MLRQVLIELSLFLTPFVIWAAYAKARGQIGEVGILAAAPVVWLVLSGLVLVAIGLAGLALLDDSGHAGLDGRYIPTHMEDGKLVPGRFDTK